jgi:nitrile hydratase subunit beta
MNGIHDLGGMHGFGTVEREHDEPVFHADWERVMVAIQRDAGRRGVFNADEFRHGIERMAPAHYLASSYYEHWLDGITRLLLEKGVLNEQELEARTAFFAEHPAVPAAVQAAVPAMPRPRLPRAVMWSERAVSEQPRFAVGDAVLTRHDAPSGHTRLPRYARGKAGVIARLHGAHVFPDANAHGAGEQPQPLYSVRFDGRELWGAAAEPKQTVCIDLWQSYLTAQPAAPPGEAR